MLYEQEGEDILDNKTLQKPSRLQLYRLDLGDNSNLEESIVEGYTIHIGKQDDVEDFCGYHTIFSTNLAGDGYKYLNVSQEEEDLNKFLEN